MCIYAFNIVLVNCICSMYVNGNRKNDNAMLELPLTQTMGIVVHLINSYSVMDIKLVSQVFIFRSIYDTVYTPYSKKRTWGDKKVYSPGDKSIWV